MSDMKQFTITLALSAIVVFIVVVCVPAVHGQRITIRPVQGTLTGAKYRGVRVPVDGTDATVLLFQDAAWEHGQCYGALRDGDAIVFMGIVACPRGTSDLLDIIMPNDKTRRGTDE